MGLNDLVPEKPLAWCLADPKYVCGSNLKLLFHRTQEIQSVWLELCASETRVSLAFTEVAFGLFLVIRSLWLMRDTRPRYVPGPARRKKVFPYGKMD